MMESSNPTSPVTIAVIGAGTIGAKHASLIAQSRDAILSTIVDPTVSGQTLADLYGARYFQDIDALLESQDKPSAAIVCTPNSTHIPIAEQLAAAGIQLLIEKPISTTYDEGLAFLRTCRERGTRVGVGHHRRLNPLVAAAKASLVSGSVGRVVGVSGVWTAMKSQEYFQGIGEWRASSAGGVILINLIHEVDLLQFLVGPIQRIYAERAPPTRGHEAEEGVAVPFRFQNGTVGTFLALDNAASPFNIENGTGENQELYPFIGQDCYRIFGQKGALSIPDNVLWTYEEHEKGRHSQMKRDSLRAEQNDAYERQLQNFIAVVRREQEPSCSGEAGLSAVAVCEAIKRSIQTGNATDVEGNC
jgi:predicted dehydrogenase